MKKTQLVFSPGKWRMSNGCEILIHDMDSSHIINVIHMLERGFLEAFDYSHKQDGLLPKSFVNKVRNRINEFIAELETRNRFYSWDPLLTKEITVWEKEVAERDYRIKHHLYLDPVIQDWEIARFYSDPNWESKYDSGDR